MPIDPENRGVIMEGPGGQLSRIEQIDDALDEIQRAREQVIAQPPSAERSRQLAEVADVEASWWEALSENSRTRVHWRAALAAREHAQHTAHRWRQSAAALKLLDVIAQPNSHREWDIATIAETAGVLR
jgi:hypothetical protein